MIKRHRLIVFFVLAYLFSWYPWFLALARGKTTGPNPLGPLVAALVVTALTEGRSGVKALLAGLVRWRVGIRWYAAVFLLPVAVCIAAACVNVLIGAPMPQLSKLAGWREVAESFVFIFLFIGLGEEPGWRGFALPKLQETRSPLAASLVLAPLWAIWHLPLMGNEFPLPIVPAFLITIFPATIITTWIYNRTNGSVLLSMLFHATVNTVGAGLIFPLFTGTNVVVLWYVYAAIWTAAAVFVVKAGGLERKANQNAAPETVATLKSPIITVT